MNEYQLTFWKIKCLAHIGLKIPRWIFSAVELQQTSAMDVQQTSHYISKSTISFLCWPGHLALVFM